MTIPVYEPFLGDAARANVIKCLDTNWISSRGEFIDQFEACFSERVGSDYSVSVCNGTVALHIAILALGIGSGDEVIVPTFTYIASVNAIRYVNATPVFVDSLADDWQIDPADVERKITNRTKAIMAVHLYGQPARMNDLVRIAAKHGLQIIEDCAEAFGSKIGERHVGNFGSVATYSFFGNKTITTGEGGMVTCNDATLDRTMRKLRGQGLVGTKEYWHDIVGYNYRMTNICAAIGLGQLTLADEFLERKRKLAAMARERLKGLPVNFLWERPGSTSSFWMNTISVENEMIRDQLRKHLSDAGIETRPAFYPAHTMPMYEKYANGEYPVALAISARGINLPSSPVLSDEQWAYVLGTIEGFYNQARIK